MRLQANKAIIDGKVTRIEPSSDDSSANLEVKVDKVSPVEGMKPFLNPEPGSTIKVYAPEVGDLEIGQSRKLTITVLGGPEGTRNVVQDVE